MSPQYNSNEKDKIPSQRKTTLKWNNDGELTSIDMARIIERLSTPELTKCDLSEISKEEN